MRSEAPVEMKPSSDIQDMISQKKRDILAKNADVSYFLNEHTIITDQTSVYQQDALSMNDELQKTNWFNLATNILDINIRVTPPIRVFGLMDQNQVLQHYYSLHETQQIPSQGLTELESLYWHKWQLLLAAEIVTLDMLLDFEATRETVKILKSSEAESGFDQSSDIMTLLSRSVSQHRKLFVSITKARQLNPLLSEFIDIPVVHFSILLTLLEVKYSDIYHEVTDTVEKNINSACVLLSLDNEKYIKNFIIILLSHLQLLSHLRLLGADDVDLCLYYPGENESSEHRVFDESSELVSSRYDNSLGDFVFACKDDAGRDINWGSLRLSYRVLPRLLSELGDTLLITLEKEQLLRYQFCYLREHANVSVQDITQKYVQDIQEVQAEISGAQWFKQLNNVTVSINPPKRAFMLMSQEGAPLSCYSLYENPKDSDQYLMPLDALLLVKWNRILKAKLVTFDMILDLEAALGSAISSKYQRLRLGIIEESGSTICKFYTTDTLGSSHRELLVSCTKGADGEVLQAGIDAPVVHLCILLNLLGITTEESCQEGSTPEFCSVVITLSNPDMVGNFSDHFLQQLQAAITSGLINATDVLLELTYTMKNEDLSDSESEYQDRNEVKVLCWDKVQINSLDNDGRMLNWSKFEISYRALPTLLSKLGDHLIAKNRCESNTVNQQAVKKPLKRLCGGDETHSVAVEAGLFSLPLDKDEADVIPVSKKVRLDGQ